MSRLEQVRPGPGLIVAIAALVAALAGTAVARDPVASSSGLSKKKVKKLTTNQINKLAPTLSVDHARTADSVASATSATTAKTASSANTANRAGSAAQVDTLQVDPVNVPASVDPGSPPKVELLSYGPFTVYGKCFGSIAAGVPVSATVYIETAKAGAVMTSDEDSRVGPGLPGDPAGGGYLDPTTAEKDRELSAKAIAGGTGVFGHDQSAFDAVHGSTKLQGQVAAYVKSGEPPSGDPGTYGPGDRCIFDAFGTQEGA